MNHLQAFNLQLVHQQFYLEAFIYNVQCLHFHQSFGVIVLTVNLQLKQAVLLYLK